MLMLDQRYQNFSRVSFSWPLYSTNLLPLIFQWFRIWKFQVIWNSLWFCLPPVPVPSPVFQWNIPIQQINHKYKVRYVKKLLISLIKVKIKMVYLCQHIDTCFRRWICRSPRHLTAIQTRNWSNVDDWSFPLSVTHAFTDAFWHQPRPSEVRSQCLLPFLLRQFQCWLHSSFTPQLFTISVLPRK